MHQESNALDVGISANHASRQRCFSGKAGVWLKKKPCFGNSLAENVHTRNIIAKTANKCLSAQVHLPLSCLVGWDEIRSRPLYTYSSRVVGSDGHLHNFTGDGFKETRETEKEDTSASALDPWNPRARSRRAFGGDRTRRPLTELMTTRLVRRDNNDEKTIEATVEKPSLSSIDDSSNAKHSCVTGDYSTSCVHAGHPKRQRDDEHLCTEYENNEECFQFDDSSVHKLGPPTRISYKRVKTLSTVIRNFVPGDGNIKEHKSLDAARAFFKKLDEQHLTLDASATPKNLTKRRCCRTRRQRRLSSPNLTEEYSRYVQACRESDVPPLAKKEYVSNRGAYFRTNEIYDGFLDE